MRLIICGAGQVGYNIAAYLVREDNDITVIDHQPQLIARINEELDVNSIVGHASDPETLSKAGAEEADMIIAVTHSDEINMVACQVAHSLFNVPKKIARVRRQNYLDPAWSNLFSRSHLPIDVIISPEIEVARAINQRLHIPGTTSVIPLANGLMYMVGVLCYENCPVVNTQLKQICGLFPDLDIFVAAILRAGKIFIPDDADQIVAGDEVFMFASAVHLKRALAVFGHEEKEARNIVILGGGNIGYYLAHLLSENYKDIRIKIIEQNTPRARELSEKLTDVIVLNGDGLQQDILQEAGIDKVETLIALTNDDETNILGSLLAKQHGCQRVITLVNKPAYSTLLTSLGIDVAVSPRSSTVSRIMQHVRRGRIKELHTLRDGIAEVIEAEVSDTTILANKTLGSFDMPEGVVIGPIIRQNKIIMPSPECGIRPGDHILTFVMQGQARKIEKIFTVHVDLF